MSDIVNQCVVFTELCRRKDGNVEGFIKSNNIIQIVILVQIFLYNNSPDSNCYIFITLFNIALARYWSLLIGIDPIINFLQAVETLSWCRH